MEEWRVMEFSNKYINEKNPICKNCGNTAFAEYVYNDNCDVYPICEDCLNNQSLWKEWEVTAGGQTEVKYYPEFMSYEEVKGDLVTECGYPENVYIKEITTI